MLQHRERWILTLYCKIRKESEEVSNFVHCHASTAFHMKCTKPVFAVWMCRLDYIVRCVCCAPVSAQYRQYTLLRFYFIRSALCLNSIFFSTTTLCCDVFLFDSIRILFLCYTMQPWQGSMDSATNFAYIFYGLNVKRCMICYSVLDWDRRLRKLEFGNTVRSFVYSHAFLNSPDGQVCYRALPKVSPDLSSRWMKCVKVKFMASLAQVCVFVCGVRVRLYEQNKTTWLEHQQNVFMRKWKRSKSFIHNSRLQFCIIWWIIRSSNVRKCHLLGADATFNWSFHVGQWHTAE